MAKKAARASKPSTTVDTVTEEAPAQTQVIERAVPAPQPWSMPTPQRGDAVIFFPRNTQSEANSEVAFVKHIGNKSIDVYSGSQFIEDVYHQDDPRLVDNPELRTEIGGVWRHGEQHIRMLELESRLRDLERKSES